jgi:hypothetical protein
MDAEREMPLAKMDPFAPGNNPAIAGAGRESRGGEPDISRKKKARSERFREKSRKYA